MGNGDLKMELLAYSHYRGITCGEHAFSVPES